MSPSIERIASLIREVVAAEVLPRFQKLAAGEITEKQPGQVVTIADTEAERRLTPLLEAALPGSLVVGEEGVAADPARLQALQGEAPVWLVDPVDGTQNFADGRPIFATMVALVRGGVPTASWIYDPINNRMATAETGGGAWIEGQRIHVAVPAPMAAMTGRLAGRTAQKLTGKVGKIFNLRCAGHEYLSVAEGRAHFAVFRRLYPWDHAPGELLVREAGGISRRQDGKPYTAREVDQTLILATDPTSWEAIRGLILEHAPER